MFVLFTVHENVITQSYRL